MSGYEQTSAKLTGAGARRLQEYLEGQNGAGNDGVDAVDEAVVTDLLGGAPDETMEQALVVRGDGSVDQVPLYVKFKGKGKGRAVTFEPAKSSVSQLHVRITFDGLSATNAEFASSIKEAKEQACALLALKLLVRNRDVHKLRA